MADNTTTPSSETGQSAPPCDLAVAKRVRRRLLSTSKERLPRVVESLLPRLLRHLDRTITTTTTATTATDHKAIQHELIESITYCRQCIQEQQPDADSSNNAMVSPTPAFVDQLVQDLVEWTSPVTTTLGVAILQCVPLDHCHIQPLVRYLEKLPLLVPPTASSTTKSTWHSVQGLLVRAILTAKDNSRRPSNSGAGALQIKPSWVLVQLVLDHAIFCDTTTDRATRLWQELFTRTSETTFLWETDVITLFAVLRNDRVVQSCCSTTTSLALALLQLCAGDAVARRCVPRDILTLLVGPIAGVDDPTWWRKPLQGTRYGDRIWKYLLDSFRPTAAAGHDQQQLMACLDLLWELSRLSAPDGPGGTCLQLMERAYRVLDASHESHAWIRGFHNRVQRTTLHFVLNTLPNGPSSRFSGAGRQRGSLRWIENGNGEQVPVVGEEAQTPLYAQQPSSLSPQRPYKRRENSVHAFRERRRFEQAINVRGAAYNLLAQFVNHGSSTEDLLPFLLFCASSECDALILPLATSLQAVASQQQSPTTRNDTTLILPAMVSVVCSPSTKARMAAASQWIGAFVASNDPVAAHHLWNHLRADPDAHVAAAAQQQAAAVFQPQPQISSMTSSWDPISLNLENLLDVEVLKGEILKKIQVVSAQFELAEDTTLLLLIDAQFSESKVAKVLENGLVVPDKGQPKHAPQAQTVYCEICFDDQVEGYSCPAQHSFCCDCWGDYFELGLQSALKVTCPRSDCSIRLPPTFLRSVAPSFADRWEVQLVETFIQESEVLSKCQQERCTGVTMILSGNAARSVSCGTCSNIFCFLCGNKPHEPASCESFRKWIKHVTSSEFWLNMNSKACPGCSVPIEKNDGCNHMHCTLCGTDFCWLCLTSLGSHLAPHMCNAIHQGDDADRRARFFAQRFRAHEDARAFESENNVTRFEGSIFMDEESIDLIDSALQVLLDAREYLANSYIAAWELSSDNRQLETFSSAQATLEMLTERLSSMMAAASLFDQSYRAGGQRSLDFTLRSLAFVADTVSKYKVRLAEICSANKRNDPNW